MTPLDFLSRNASAYRDCTAEVDGVRRFTYAEMQCRVHSFGAALQRTGIAPGDRVAVLARNGLLPLEAHFAVPLIGAVGRAIAGRLRGSPAVGCIKGTHEGEAIRKTFGRVFRQGAGNRGPFRFR